MTVRIQARTDGQSWVDCIDAEGASLPHAVRQAAKRLGLGPGRTLSREKVGSSQWRWNWSGHTIHVVQLADRTALTNAHRGRRMVTVTLAPETLKRLDELCRLRGEKRGRVLDALVRDASGSERR